MKYIDSVYGSINFPDKYSSYLELRPLTRLRNIKQLGFTPSVYTGAVHTRFEHTIGKTWVLINILDQFHIEDEHLKMRFIIASLLSEIGTFPFSYSTHWLFAKKMGLSKKYYAELLFDSYITSLLNLNETDKQFVLNNNENDQNWLKKRLPCLEIFPDLTILKLAGDIDYAIRDSHYSGRYSNSFDFRYFRTLVDFNSASCKDELIESIRELYRSIYSLNSVYGDKTRRFITLIFVRLANFLIENDYLKVEKYRKASEFIELDDDKFMSILRTAAEDAIREDYHWVKGMIEYVEQLNTVAIEEIVLTKEQSIMSIEEIEDYIAKKEGIDKKQVIAISDNRKNVLDYVLFGKRFDCFNDAINSEYFRNMTGLFTGSNRTNLLNDKLVFYTVIK